MFLAPVEPDYSLYTGTTISAKTVQRRPKNETTHKHIRQHAR